MHYVSQTTHGSHHEHTNAIHLAMGATTGSKQPLYHHRACKCTNVRPHWPRDSNQTLSGYWEVNGTKAHCLLDSRCKGVMISPGYTQATGIRTFKLEHPVGLQLACVGSKSMINYGANSTIVFNDMCIEEYFNVANIDYYNVILGMLFLWQLGITLDFTGQGAIRIGAQVVPRNLLLAPVDGKLQAAVHKQLPQKPPE